MTGAEQQVLDALTALGIARAGEVSLQTVKIEEDEG
jgi:hypothetical protein